MAVHTRYHEGGFVASAPQQNRAELYDSAADTYTAWDQAGVQTAQRALTAAERTWLLEADAVLAADSNRASLTAKAQAALATNAAFLAVGTSATAAQVRTQTIALTKECNALIRLLLNQLDDVSDT